MQLKSPKVRWASGVGTATVAAALSACTGLVEGTWGDNPDLLQSTDAGTLPRGADGGAKADASIGSDAAPTPWVPETICQPWASPSGPKDQSVVPLEVLPKNAGAKKVVLVAGHAGHGPGQHEFFAGNALLAKLLCRVPGVTPVLVRDSWPRNPAVFAGAAAIVMYLDGGDNHPLVDANKRALVGPEIAAGAGFVNLHYAVEYPNSIAPTILPWIGGRYDTNVSHNPYWTPSFDGLPSHAITRGVGSLVTEDEWYYDLTFAASGVTPLAIGRGANNPAPSTGSAQTLAWAYNRPDGGRSFGFTGGHFLGNWCEGKAHDEAQRRLVINAILWSAGLEVPAGGADVSLESGWCGSWVDTK